MEKQNEKTAAEQLREKLQFKPENGGKSLTPDEIRAADTYCTFTP